VTSFCKTPSPPSKTQEGQARKFARLSECLLARRSKGRKEKTPCLIPVWFLGEGDDRIPSTNLPLNIESELSKGGSFPGRERLPPLGKQKVETNIPQSLTNMVGRERGREESGLKGGTTGVSAGGVKRERKTANFTLEGHKKQIKRASSTRMGKARAYLYLPYREGGGGKGP